MERVYIEALRGEASLKKLIAKNIDINIKSTGGYTSLIFAARNGNIKVAKILLDCGADINSIDNEGSTALIIASSTGSEEIVKLLLERGANVNISNNQGATALIVASHKGNEKIVELLLAQRDIDIDVFTDSGSALFYAVSAGHEKIVKLLLKSGAKVHINKKVGKGFQTIYAYDLTLNPSLLFLLDNTMKRIYIETLKGEKSFEYFLNTTHADINIKDNNGNTALFLALEKENIASIKLLLERGVNVNSVNNKGETPLIFASKNGLEKVVEFLVNYQDIDVTAKDKDGKNAYNVAKKENIKHLLAPYFDIKGKFIKYDEEKRIEISGEKISDEFLEQNCNSVTKSWWSQDSYDQIIKEGDDILIVKIGNIFHCFTAPEVKNLLETRSRIFGDLNEEAIETMKKFIS